MQRQEDVCYFLDLQHDIVSLKGVHQSARWNHLQLHGPDLLGRFKILSDNTEAASVN